MRVPMLAVDDAGIEPLEVMEYDHAVGPMVELLTRRYAEQLLTLLTTDLMPGAYANTTATALPTGSARWS